MTKLALLTALLLTISGCAWTWRHLFPDCGNADFYCTDACGCQSCDQYSPLGNGCDAQIHAAGAK